MLKYQYKIAYFSYDYVIRKYLELLIQVCAHLQHNKNETPIPFAKSSILPGLK